MRARLGGCKSPPSLLPLQQVRDFCWHNGVGCALIVPLSSLILRSSDTWLRQETRLCWFNGGLPNLRFTISNVFLSSIRCQTSNCSSQPLWDSLNLVAVFIMTFPPCPTLPVHRLIPLKGAIKKKIVKIGHLAQQGGGVWLKPKFLLKLDSVQLCETQF